MMIYTMCFLLTLRALVARVARVGAVTYVGSNTGSTVETDGRTRSLLAVHAQPAVTATRHNSRTRHVYRHLLDVRSAEEKNTFKT